MLIFTEFSRTMDQLLSKGYFYWARGVELTGKASNIRNELLAAYRTSVLKHDQIGQVCFSTNPMFFKY
jgi:hypothetical protein